MIAQADLSLRWAHISDATFSDIVTHLHVVRILLNFRSLEIIGLIIYIWK